MSETTLPDGSAPVKPEFSPSTGSVCNMLPVWCAIFLFCNVVQAVLILVVWLA